MRVIDGDAATLGNLGHVSVASGTTIGVEGRGDRLRFTVNGEVRRSLVDGALRGLHGAGSPSRPARACRSRTGTTSAPRAAPAPSPMTSTDPTTPGWARRRRGHGRALDGRWGIRDGQASVVRSVTKGRNLALTDVGADARISVTLTTGAPPRPVVDEFDRPDSPASLGVAPTGQRWRARRGVWGIAGGAAYVSHPDSGGDLALVQGGAADGTVTATIGKVGPGAGSCSGAGGRGTAGGSRRCRASGPGTS